MSVEDKATKLAEVASAELVEVLPAQPASASRQAVRRARLVLTGEEFQQLVADAVTGSV